MRSPLRLSAALLLSLSVAMPSAVLAEKGGHGHGKHGEEHPGKGHGKHHGKHDGDRGRGGDRVVIHNSDRVVIREYVADRYRADCPPGLAKKHNGCLPPGQAKKRYVVGQRLPDVVVYEQVPQPLLVQLQPVPVGYQYVMVDRDVLLISEASHHVIDAITLLSAVGK